MLDHNSELLFVQKISTAVKQQKSREAGRLSISALYRVARKILLQPTCDKGIDISLTNEAFSQPILLASDIDNPPSVFVTWGQLYYLLK
ncbi:Uncharacterized protein TCM_029469 [Theobroma cacao]|uniref:Uncharacterized protein n=1 Tax=Theobroma cacao TaxID=3641 RepID=A0A061GDQ8_THECC|nr:Uncharacterized protein TCM_029469 [Theobroma cacao]